MPTLNSRRGFTLIEILCAMGAFILVFLTGYGGLLRLMMTQTTNQQRTVAASAALLVADWHASQWLITPASFETHLASIADKSIPYPTVKLLTNNWPASLSDKKKHWRGSLPDENENVYTFKTSAVLGVPYSATLDLTAYDMIIMTVTTPSTAEPAPSDMKFHVVTFWYGDKSSVTSNISDRFEFLGSYLMPDEKP